MREAALLTLCVGLSLAAPGIEDFLHQHGFSNVTEAFLGQQVGMEVIKELTDDDLKDLGLRTIGRRRAFMMATRTLSSEVEMEGVEAGGREEEREEGRGEEEGGRREGGREVEEGGGGQSEGGGVVGAEG